MSSINQKRNRKVIIYSRVSTDEQAERGFSLSDQEERLRKYCAVNGHDVVAHFQDDYSAKDFNRPEFQKMLFQLKAKTLKADLFLAVRFDRFSRNAELTLSMIRELKKYGLEFNTIEQTVDLTSPESLLMLLINSGLPQIENERRALNTKRGMRQAQKAGRWVASAPKGYSNSQINGEKTIVPNEDANLIIFAFQQLATGLYNIQQVRKQLWDRGSKNSKSSFNKLVKNPVYMGKIKIAAWQDEEEMLVDGIHEPLISEELFNTVQDVLEGKKFTARPKNRTDENFPLRGFLDCPQCGNPLTASFSQGRTKKYGYYHCQCGCKERQKYEEINSSFVAYLRNFEVDFEVMNLYYLILQDVFNKDKAEKEVEKKHILALLDSTTQKLNSLTDKYLEDLISQEDYVRNKVRFENDINQFQQQKNELELEQKDFIAQIQYTFGLLKDISSYYEKAEIEVKQKLIGSIFPEKLLYENKKYRTTEINSVIPLICSNINSFGEIKEKRIVNNNNPSSVVASPGIEPGSKV